MRWGSLPFDKAGYPPKGRGDSTTSLPHSRKDEGTLRIQVGTNYVFEDEPCLKLWECDIQSPDSSGFHRYLVFDVLRNGERVEFKEDCGSVEKFRGVEPVILWTGIVDGGAFYGHRVGDARVMLDQYRNHVHFDNKELVGVNDLILR